MAQETNRVCTLDGVAGVMLVATMTMLSLVMFQQVDAAPSAGDAMLASDAGRPLVRNDVVLTDCSVWKRLLRVEETPDGEVAVYYGQIDETGEACEVAVPVIDAIPDGYQYDNLCYIGPELEGVNALDYPDAAVVGTGEPYVAEETYEEQIYRTGGLVYFGEYGVYTDGPCYYFRSNLEHACEADLDAEPFFDPDRGEFGATVQPGSWQDTLEACEIVDLLPNSEATLLTIGPTDSTLPPTGVADPGRMALVAALVLAVGASALRLARRVRFTGGSSGPERR